MDPRILHEYPAYVRYIEARLWHLDRLIRKLKSLNNDEVNKIIEKYYEENYKLQSILNDAPEIERKIIKALENEKFGLSMKEIVKIVGYPARLYIFKLIDEGKIEVRRIAPGKKYFRLKPSSEEFEHSLSSPVPQVSF